MTEQGMTPTAGTSATAAAAPGTPALAALAGKQATRGSPPPLLGALDPAGWVVVALPSDASASAMAQALAARGLPGSEMRQLGAAEMSEWLRSLLFDAALADQLRDLRDFYIQALEGCGWLMVRTGDSESEAQVEEEALHAGARSITRYAPPVVTPVTRH